MTVGDLMEVISSGRKVRGIPRMRSCYGKSEWRWAPDGSE